MTRDEHISWATAHLLAAIHDRDTAYADGLRGSPLVEFDSEGQELHDTLSRIASERKAEHEGT